MAEIHPYAERLAKNVDRNLSRQKFLPMRDLLAGFGCQRRTEGNMREILRQLEAAGLQVDFSPDQLPALDGKVCVSRSGPPSEATAEAVDTAGPPLVPPETPSVPQHPFAEQLARKASRRSSGRIQVTVRDLLRGFGYQRRTEWIISDVLQRLSESGIAAQLSVAEPSSLDAAIDLQKVDSGATATSVVSTASAATTSAAAASTTAAPGSPARPQPTATTVDLRDLAELGLQASVEIYAGDCMGSGFIVHADGLVVTGRHVVDDGGRSYRTVKVKLANGAERDGTVFRSHRCLDLALLWLSEKGPYPRLPMGNAQALRPAETVLAIGAPAGLTKTVTKGCVCNPRQMFSGVECIQTDTAISHGNSGGPLLAHDGVVGVALWGLGDVSSAHFAVPLDYFHDDIDEAIRRGRKACLDAAYCRRCGHADYDKSTWFCRNCGRHHSDAFTDEPETEE